MRESPSGKASAFQADIRGFESRLPLSVIPKCTLVYLCEPCALRGEGLGARSAAVSAGDS